MGTGERGSAGRVDAMLLAYDQALRQGHVPSAVAAPPVESDENQAEFRGLQRCLRMLETAWPRAGSESLECHLQAVDLAIEQTSPSQAAMAAEEREALQRAMESLPERYREVILLHHREGLSFLEISRRMDCSAEAARKLWLRAVRKLQQQIEAPDGDG